MQGFLMEVYHAKKRKGKRLSFTRLLNNKFLCFRQVVTKHKSKYVSMSTSETTSCIFWTFCIRMLLWSILERYLYIFKVDTIQLSMQVSLDVYNQVSEKPWYNTITTTNSYKHSSCSLLAYLLLKASLVIIFVSKLWLCMLCYCSFHNADGKWVSLTTSVCKKMWLYFYPCSYYFGNDIAYTSIRIVHSNTEIHTYLSAWVRESQWACMFSQNH